MRLGLEKSLTVAAAMTCALASGAQAAITISNAKTKNVTCAGGVCAPTGTNANLNTGELQTMLASSDVTVKSSAGTPTLGVLDPLTWASTHRLTLDSYQSIHVRSSIVVEGTSGLTLVTNDGGTGGDYIFEDGGYASFWDLASSLIINGQSYTLVGNIRTLAGDIKRNPAGYYALAASYDASVDGAYSTAPVQKPLQGIFNGLGNTIKNFTLSPNPSNKRGLFAEIAEQGSVRSVMLTNATVSGRQGFVSITGTLAAINSGYIDNAFASGFAGAPSTVGGLVGINNGKIEFSYTDVAVTGYRMPRAQTQEVLAGGLAGDNSGTIVDCHAKGDVVLEQPSFRKRRLVFEIGGLAGNNQQSGVITASSASGSVFGVLEVGGLVGENAGSITQSFASGSVTGVMARHETFLGGLIGRTLYTSAVSDSYSTGSVAKGEDAHGYAGGFLGTGAGTFVNSYSTGKVSGYRGRGGFAGAVTNSLTAAYWDKSTSGLHHHGVGSGATPDGLTGLTDDQLKSALPAGFDPNVWGQSANINNGWPYLLANPPQ